MLHTGYLKIIDAQDTPIVPGQSVPAEGLPLVREIVNGKEHVRVGSDVKAPFIGFSYTESLTPVIKSRVEILKADVDTGKFTLAAAPITGQVSFYDETGAMIEGVVVEDKVATAADNKGQMIRCQYRYQPTVDEVLMSDRILVPSMAASDMTGTIGVILEGIIYTDMFEASVDFSDVNIKLAVSTNGLVTKQDDEGSLAEIPGVVVSVPGVDTPFLGIRVGY